MRTAVSPLRFLSSWARHIQLSAPYCTDLLLAPLQAAGEDFASSQKGNSTGAYKQEHNEYILVHQSVACIEHIDQHDAQCALHSQSSLGLIIEIAAWYQWPIDDKFGKRASLR